jgi:site-specific recombinase XerD
MARRRADPHTLDLFNTTDQWDTDPRVAFAALVTTPAFVRLRRGTQACAMSQPQVLRSQSAHVYIAMFGRFHQWMLSQDLQLRRIDKQAIAQFLQTRNRCGRPMASGIRLRYVRMLERVYDHLGMSPNPARQAAMDLFATPGAAGRDRSKAWLADADQAKFMAALPDPVTWKDRRDRAMIAMLLGAGLTVGEVIRIRVADVSVQQDRGSVWVDVNPHATAGELHRQHRALLRDFAVDDVLAWCGERTAIGIRGDLLFASTRSGKAMNPSTVFRKVKANFARAGLDPGRRGGRTLRNSYARRELLAGGATRGTIEHVTELLGLHEQRSTLRYLTGGIVPAKGRRQGHLDG